MRTCPVNRRKIPCRGKRVFYYISGGGNIQTVCILPPPLMYPKSEDAYPPLLDINMVCVEEIEAVLRSHAVLNGYSYMPVVDS